ncbi:hypothetical protein GMMP15_660048 [Candidatus Magnetomoraceae bacterium gMMP-15]
MQHSLKNIKTDVSVSPPIFKAVDHLAKRKAPSLSKKESELLFKINRGLPSKIQRRFNELTAKRQAETLTPSEHKELLKLIEQIENMDAEHPPNH